MMDFVRYACGEFWHFIAITLLIATFGSWSAIALRQIFGGRRRG